MIISMDTEKAFEKIQPLFMIKVLSKVGMRGSYLNIIKAIYMINPELTSYLMVKSWKIFKIRYKTRMCTFTTFIQHSIGSPSHSNETGKRSKRHPHWKERSKTVIICRWHDIICRAPWRFCEVMIRINEFSKIAEYKINIQRLAAFL